MTAEINVEYESCQSEDSPCKIRLFETKSLFQDQFELCMFCQIHKCSDYCLKKKKNKVDDLPGSLQAVDNPK